MLFIRRCFIESVPQAADGHYIYAILPTVGIIKSGVPLHLDISDLPMRKGIITNRNKFILGPSGRDVYKRQPRTCRASMFSVESSAEYSPKVWKR